MIALYTKIKRDKFEFFNLIPEFLSASLSVHLYPIRRRHSRILVLFVPADLKKLSTGQDSFISLLQIFKPTMGSLIIAHICL